jgi:hypothetical protein
MRIAAARVASVQYTLSETARPKAGHGELVPPHPASASAAKTSTDRIAPNDGGTG